MKKVFVLSYLSFFISYLSFGQNVGIGTTSPASKLHVKGTGSGNQIVLEESTGIMLRISNEATAIGPYIGTTSNHPLTLVSNNSGRMTIATNGNVGIGTTSPQQQLSVAGGAVIDQNNNNIGTSAAMLSFGSSSGEGVGSKRTSGTNQYGLDFYTNNLQRMTVTNGGNMGIGTTTPTQKLEVNGAIKIGTTSTASDGSIRYNTNKFEGYNGTSWQSFDQIPSGGLVYSLTYPNTSLENNGYDFLTAIPCPGISQPLTGVAADSWLPTSTGLFINPGERQNHKAIWTGSEMIIWGGSDGSQITPAYFNTGARYNPSTNIWTTVSTTNAPAARVEHTAIWTGTEMIIWGGYFFSLGVSSFNTGARYNPSTNTWTTVSTTNAPSARYLHTAIWTGTEMIVWGGSDGLLYNNTGAKYNPSTNTWTALPTTNAPSGRYLHTAIWTGTEMIIWGGSDGTAVNNTGAKYNPSTNTWTTLPTTNAPAARNNHTAIWTGTQMIVWGGSDGINNVNTGAKYDPFSNIWISVTTSNAPSARSFFTATWTGAEMIIWGGENGANNLFNTGGRYNATSNSWITTSITNAASIRSFHTAVWTGLQMIVYGGKNGTVTSEKSGGRYFPTALPSYITAIESSGSIYLYNKQ